MIDQFKNLSQSEKDILVKAPILVSVLAASEDHEITKSQKEEAIELAHIKTFSADPLLIPYYKEVAGSFKKQFSETVKKYAPFDDKKRDSLKKEIGELNGVIAKLDKNFARALHFSLEGYAEHVKKAENTLLVNFIFPIPIPGLTE